MKAETRVSLRLTWVVFLWMALCFYFRVPRLRGNPNW